MPVVVVGGGACGLSAALAARDTGAEVLVLEADARLGGTTAMSTGLIPAAGTPEQAAEGIVDTPDRFAADILAKTKEQTDRDLVGHLTAASAATVAWLKDRHSLPLSLVGGFTYPGHSVRRMMGTPHRTGSELMASLEAACSRAQVDILTAARVETLHADRDSGSILAVSYRRPDGARDAVGCDALILACCGFAGNAEMVAHHIPDMHNATFHGHPGNKGEAMAWGRALGAGLADMSAYQGHAGLASGHGVPILWPLIMEGGFQVNRQGARFADESRGYSEQAVDVLAQDGAVAWSVFDQRLYDMMMQFDDFQQAVAAGAVVKGADWDELAARARVDAAGLAQTAAAVDAAKAGAQADPLGRDFSGIAPLSPPFYAARVTGALFHTQGGLRVDACARVLTEAGTPLPNLFAGGGAARGISGPGADGYLAGNGLLTATTLGRLAGTTAARQVLARASVEARA